jgi:hypothetical protein
MMMRPVPAFLSGDKAVDSRVYVVLEMQHVVQVRRAAAGGSKVKDDIRFYSPKEGAGLLCIPKIN